MYNHCLIRFNVSSENNDEDYQFSKISTFQKKNSDLNALGSKFDLGL